MFKPRHAYRSPVTNRYRGKAKGCPVFNNLSEINSNMVEQHDECLECLAKLKNRTELYRTLADNNKPSNNVIKSLQRLSSSASNNRLKTCLQFLIIKVNEKSISTPSTATSNGSTTTTTSTKTVLEENHQHSDATTITKDASTTSIVEHDNDVGNNHHPVQTTTRHLAKRQKSNHNQGRNNLYQKQQSQKQKLNQLASPPQDQVSSTQDQVGPTQDDHDCQTSPAMLSTTHIDEVLVVNTNGDHHDMKLSDEEDENSFIASNNSNSHTKGNCTNNNKNEEQQTEYVCAQTTQPSPPIKYDALSTSTSTSTSTVTDTIAIVKTSPKRTDDLKNHLNNNNGHSATINSDTMTVVVDRINGKNSPLTTNSKTTGVFTTSTGTTTAALAKTTEIRQSPAAKRRRTQNSLSSDQETSSIASWSLASYGLTSPPSPMSSASSTSSMSSTSSSSSYTSSFCSSSSCSSSSPCNSPSPSPTANFDHNLVLTDLKTPRLKLSDDKIRKIKKKPIVFDDFYYYTEQPSVASTPTTSSGCSPGQHSNTTQNSEQSNGSRSLGPFACGNIVSHTFQAPPTFINNLKPCNLPLKSQQSPPQTSAPPPTTRVEMINCAICGIKDKPPNISKVYGQNSCSLCTDFFAGFLKRPQQLYCAQDGDCLMTFDSRCQACWIKICLQKFDIDEEYRKVGDKFSPKLLSSPNVSLITIDTSIVS